MAKTSEVTVPAKRYEDEDDCLAAAAANVAQERGLERWQCEARWADDDRDEIVVTVPAIIIEVGDVVQEWTPDEGEPSDMQAYVQVEATRDGEPITLGVMVGVPDHTISTARAAGGDVIGPYLRTWWADASDWQHVGPTGEDRLQAEEALASAAPRLWREAMSLREARS